MEMTVKKLCIDNFVICLQGHWLKTDQLHLLNNIAIGFDSYAISFIPNDQFSSFYGWLYGDLAILVKFSVFKVVKIGSSINSRVQAFLLNMSNVKIFLFNVYYLNLPVSTDVDYVVDLNVMCGFILQSIDNHAVDGTHIYVCVDFNVKWSVIDVDERLSCFKSIISSCNFYPILELYTRDIKYTYSYLSRNIFSWRNNIFIPQAVIANGFKTCSVEDDVDNNTDQFGFICEICYDVMPVADSQGASIRGCICRNVYVSGSDKAKFVYYNSTGDILRQDCECRNILKCCQNVPCTDSSHCLEIKSNRPSQPH